jgi:hypothetical protein
MAVEAESELKMADFYVSLLSNIWDAFIHC